MHTLKRIFLSSLPKLILKMAAFALTSQISELDNFDIDTSFQDFVKETQHKLLSPPDMQNNEEAAPINYDLSSFMSINFEAKEQQTNTVVRDSIEAFVENELTNQGRDLLFEDLPEEDVATAVVHQDTKFSAEELVCLEVLENGFQEPLKEGFIEETFNYSEHAFSFTQDAVTVTKSIIPSVLSLKKSMAYKQALRTAIDSRLRMELEDFNIPKKSCKKRSIIMQGWRSTDPNNPFAKARDQFLDEIFAEILDISTKIENSEYGYLASTKRK